MSLNSPLQFMKYISLILASFTGVLVIPTSAQEKPNLKPRRVEPQVRPAFGALLARPAIAPRGVALDLTEQQEQQIATLRKDHSAAIRELIQNRELDPQDRRDQLRDLSIDLQEAIKAVYTPEQRVKLAKAEQEAAKRREEMQKLRIVLSDEQKAKGKHRRRLTKDRCRVQTNAKQLSKQANTSPTLAPRI